ncbi:MAG: response regulator [Actinomycetota bacterium]
MARIIAIEDSTALQRLLQITMRGTGFDIESHITAADGLAAATEGPPSLIILDLGLPDRSGWEVLEHLRAHSTTSDIPVIITTGQSSGTVAERAAAFDAVILEKPYTGAVLRATVELLTRGRSTAAALS